MLDQVEMRIEVLKGETEGRLRTHFKQKVQLEERLEENEINLHYTRGLLAGLDQAVKEIQQIKEGQNLEEVRDRALERRKLQFNKSPDGKSFDATIVAQNVEVSKLAV